MRRTLWTFLAATALTIPALAQAPAAKPHPTVQLAILLDTSNSMDGLIDQAKTQLWKIVNEFAKAQRDGIHPDIQVALYQYGTPTRPSSGRSRPTSTSNGTSRTPCFCRAATSPLCTAASGRSWPA